MEELQHTDEDTKPSKHDKILCFVLEPRKLVELQAIFDGLKPILHSAEFKEAVPEERPYLNTM